MSPRRVFAAPFVITLAAAPAGADTAPNPPPPSKNPPPPREPAKYEQHWHVTRSADKKTCSAMPRVSCPQGEPGKPRPTCNPPPPRAYACPDSVRDDAFDIVLEVGATTCHVVEKPPSCKPGATCNPPAPRVVPCP